MSSSSIVHWHVKRGPAAIRPPGIPRARGRRRQAQLVGLATGAQILQVFGMHAGVHERPGGARHLIQAIIRLPRTIRRVFHLGEPRTFGCRRVGGQGSAGVPQEELLAKRVRDAVHLRRGVIMQSGRAAERGGLRPFFER